MVTCIVSPASYVKDAGGGTIPFGELRIENNYSDRQAAIIAPGCLVTIALSSVGQFMHPRRLAEGLMHRSASNGGRWPKRWRVSGAV